MQFTTRTFRLDSPDFVDLYVRRAGLIPLEMIMGVSLTMIGIGLLGNKSPLGGMVLVFAFLVFAFRFLYKPGMTERFVKFTQGGGAVAVTRVGIFQEDGFIIRPDGAPEDATKGVYQMPWAKLDRVEIEGGYIFFLPFAGPRGIAVPEKAFSDQDLKTLLAFLDEKSLIRHKTEGTKTETPAEP